MQTPVITNSPVDVSLADVTASAVVVSSSMTLVVVSNGSESWSCSAVVSSIDFSVVLSVKTHDGNVSTQPFSD